MIVVVCGGDGWGGLPRFAHRHTKKEEKKTTHAYLQLDIVVVPAVMVLVGRQGVPGEGDPGVANEAVEHGQVEGVVVPNGLVHGMVGGQVQRNGVHRGVGGDPLNVLHRLLQLLRVSRGQDDRGSVPRQDKGHLPPDAARGARDEEDAAPDAGVVLGGDLTGGGGRPKVRLAVLLAEHVVQQALGDVQRARKHGVVVGEERGRGEGAVSRGVWCVLGEL